MTARAGDASLRATVRQLRRSISASERAGADASILQHIRILPAYRAARRVALFFAFDGEPDIGKLIRLDQSREFFAPVLFGKDMHFASVGRHTRLVPNFFGIPEPTPIELIDPRSLDIVLTPMVAFDDLGNRIGVGAGYYDRCFSFLRQRKFWFKPKLTGIGYSLQRVDRIRPNPWDVPLWGAVTERGFAGFGNR